MNTCDTCKWWDPEGVSGFYIHKGFGRCAHVKLYDCIESDGAAIDESEIGTNPFIVTGPWFGCVHHEPK